MRKFFLIAVAAASLGGTAAIAQDAGHRAPDANAANAAAMPVEGTDQALQSPAGANAQGAPQEQQTYPVCSRAVTDECVNPRESGRNYGNRPLNYWPGHPASDQR